MIAFLSVPIALAFPLLEGMLLLSFLERRKHVLSHLERLCTGFFLGLPFSSFLFFFAFLAGVPLTFFGFLVLHLLLIAALLLLAWKWVPKRSLWKLLFPQDAPSCSFGFSGVPQWIQVVCIFLLLWVLFKIAIGAYDLFAFPPYFNDIYANWNMRAKAFFTSQSLLLDLPRSHRFFFGGRVPSYPLTVYFTKVWLAMVSGGWNEAAVNSVHLLWFLALIGMFAAALSRLTSAVFATLGVFVLVSLPLFFLHGVNAYADVLMSASLFLPLLFWYRWMLEEDETGQHVWLLLQSVSSALMLFVKSEALLLFLPPLTLLLALSSLWKTRSLRISIRTMGVFLGIVSLVLLPWALFKVIVGLEFGNAQSVGQFVLSPHPDVPLAVLNELFYTGSFLLFSPVFLLFLALSWRYWSHHAVGFLLLFLGIVLLGQFGIYYLTPLAAEAIRHTGYGRGIVQLLPSLTFIAMLLLQSIIATSIRERSRVLPSPPR